MNMIKGLGVADSPTRTRGWPGNENFWRTWTSSEIYELDNQNLIMEELEAKIPEVRAGESRKTNQVPRCVSPGRQGRVLVVNFLQVLIVWAHPHVQKVFVPVSPGRRLL